MEGCQKQREAEVVRKGSTDWRTVVVFAVRRKENVCRSDALCQTRLTCLLGEGLAAVAAGELAAAASEERT